MMESIAFGFLMIVILGVGYIIGLLQNGINIHYKGADMPEDYNSSIGIEEYADYTEKNVEVRE